MKKTNWLWAVAIGLGAWFLWKNKASGNNLPPGTHFEVGDLLAPISSNIAQYRVVSYNPDPVEYGGNYNLIILATGYTTAIYGNQIESSYHKVG